MVETLAATILGSLIVGMTGLAFTRPRTFARLEPWAASFFMALCGLAAAYEAGWFRAMQAARRALPDDTMQLDTSHGSLGVWAIVLPGLAALWVFVLGIVGPRLRDAEDDQPRH